MTPQFAAYLGDIAAQHPAARVSPACLAAQQQLARAHAAARAARVGHAGCPLRGSSGSAGHAQEAPLAQGGDAARQHGAAAAAAASACARCQGGPAEAQPAPGGRACKAPQLQGQVQQRAAPASAVLGRTGTPSMPQEEALQGRCGSLECEAPQQERSSSFASGDSQPQCSEEVPNRVRVPLQCCSDKPARR